MSEHETPLANPSDEAQPSVQGAFARWLILAALTLVALAAAFGWAIGSIEVDPASSYETADVPPMEMPSGPAVPGPSGASYPPPNFQLTSLDGALLGPKDFAGKVVVIDFWATWCGPCRLQAKILDKLHEQVGEDVQFLAVNVGEERETVAAYTASTPFPYPVLLDPDEQLMRAYRLSGLPTMMVVDREGNIAFLRTGVVDAPSLKTVIAKVGGASA